MGVGLFLEKWVRVGRYYQNKGRNVSFLLKMGGIGLLFLKIEWWWVILVEKWGEVGCFLSNNGRERVFFLKKWVREGHFS